MSTVEIERKIKKMTPATRKRFFARFGFVRANLDFSDEETASINKACEEGWQDYLDGKAIPAEQLLKRFKA